MDDMLTIVRHELEARRGTLPRVARDNGMSYMTLIRIMHGTTDPGYSKVLRLYRYLLREQDQEAA